VTTPLPTPDEYVLLCERCGYIIEGLPTESTCPECGKPIAESLPERRILEPSALATLHHPIKSLDGLRIGGNPMSKLRNRCVLAGVVGCVSVQAAAIITSSVFQTSNAAGAVMLVAPFLAFAFAIGFLALSLIEARGLRFIGRARGHRITGHIALWIVASGSAGWIVSAIGLGVFCSSFIVGLVMILDDYDNSVIAGSTNPSVRIVDLVGFAGLAVALAGFLFFETFAWLGLRRLKYANRVRPDAPPPSAHAARD
jgi:hypothetical protein